MALADFAPPPHARRGFRPALVQALRAGYSLADLARDATAGVVVAAVAIPLYYYRHRLVAWMEGRTQADDETPGSGETPGPGT